MSKTDTYSCHIYRFLKQVHPKIGIARKAMAIMESFVHDLFERIASEAARLARYNKDHIISSREVQTSVRLVLPGELAKHAVSEGTKAVAKYGEEYPAPRGSRLSSIARFIRRKFVDGGYAKNVADATSYVYMTAVLEYIASEVLELAGNVCQARKSMRITPNDIKKAVGQDEELARLLGEVTFPVCAGFISKSGVEQPVEEKVAKAPVPAKKGPKAQVKKMPAMKKAPVPEVTPKDRAVAAKYAKILCKRLTAKDHILVYEDPAAFGDDFSYESQFEERLCWMLESFKRLCGREQATIDVRGDKKESWLQEAMKTFYGEEDSKDFYFEVNQEPWLQKIIKDFLAAAVPAIDTFDTEGFIAGLNEDVSNYFEAMFEEMSEAKRVEFAKHAKKEMDGFFRSFAGWVGE